jgi:parvulin-like peptidyl-prolyl isomerase
VNFQKTRLDKVCYFQPKTFPRQISSAHAFSVFAGGALGWKVRGSLHGEFEKIAYDLEPSTTGNPKYAEVKTGHGYHIIMVEGRK